VAVFRGRRIEVFGQQRQDQPRDLWDNENQAKYDSKLINLWVPVAGVTDQFLVEVKDLYETVDLAGQFFSHPYETVSGIYDLFSGLTVEQLKTVLGEAVEREVRAFKTPARKRQYKVSRAVTASV
jgi:hypothetical protein